MKLSRYYSIALLLIASAYSNAFAQTQTLDFVCEGSVRTESGSSVSVERCYRLVPQSIQTQSGYIVAVDRAAGKVSCLGGKFRYDQLSASWQFEWADGSTEKVRLHQTDPARNQWIIEIVERDSKPLSLKVKAKRTVGIPLWASNAIEIDLLKRMTQAERDEYLKKKKADYDAARRALNN